MSQPGQAKSSPSENARNAVGWKTSSVHEALATLYLRLNGYFTTGLVVPSPEWGKNLTDGDCIAVRFPGHSQRERQVKCSPFLALRAGEVDLIICEVKSDLEHLHFNDPLRKNKEALRAVIRWAGLFEEGPSDLLADRLRELVQLGVGLNDAREGVVGGGCRVRPLLCCPPLQKELDDRWCLTGPEMFRFMHECFDPSQPRDTCSTRYNLLQWGYALEPLVDYFKNGVGPGGSPNLVDLYAHLGVTSPPPPSAGGSA